MRAFRVLASGCHQSNVVKAGRKIYHCDGSHAFRMDGVRPMVSSTAKGRMVHEFSFHELPRLAKCQHVEPVLAVIDDGGSHETEKIFPDARTRHELHPLDGVPRLF